MRLPAVLRYLVFFLPVLVVSFAVLMGAGAIARLAGDEVAELVMLSGSLGAALLIAIDVILLVGVLGIKALIDSDRQHRRERKKHMKGRGRRGGRRRGGRRHGRHRDHAHEGE